MLELSFASNKFLKVVVWTFILHRIILKLFKKKEKSPLIYQKELNRTLKFKITWSLGFVSAVKKEPKSNCSYHFDILANNILYCYELFDFPGLCLQVIVLIIFVKTKM